MAESDEPGKSRTSPAPELNPLLNPILNKNLGRWAEVYFKSPPDKRDEAVQQLLQELESEDPQPEFTTAPTHAFQPQPYEQQYERTRKESAFPSGPRLVCQSCGFVTRPNQKFCGRCGIRLGSPSAPMTGSWPSEEPKPERVPSPWELEARDFPASHEVSGPDSAEYKQAPVQTEVASDGEESLLDLDSQSAPPWYAYRYVIAAGSALLVAVLLFLVWRGGSAPTRASRPPQQAPAETAPQPPSATVRVQETSAADQPAPEHSAPPAAVPPKRATGTEPGIQPKGELGMSSSPAPARSAPAKDNTPSTADQTLAVQPLAGNGSQELAIALEFMDGRGGREVNSSEAAEWLWKSVAKSNTSATLLLARLYLRGDGVQKNCDQGRILLDAAAKKGNKEAASMLQNLQGFGCP